MVWHGMACPAAAAEQPNSMRMVWYSMAWHGMACPAAAAEQPNSMRMVWYSMAWHGLMQQQNSPTACAWYGTV